MGVFDGVDLAAAVPPGGDQPGEAEFREVLADGGDRGSGACGEGPRYRPAYVWVGVAAAFLVQMAVAVTAGQVLVTVLPHRVVEAVVAVLFTAGAAWLLVASFRAQDRDGADAARQGGPPPSFWRVAGASFAVVFAAEWGDITQITTANLAARYGDPVSVGIGAVLACWLLTALAVTVGAKSPWYPPTGGVLRE